MGYLWLTAVNFLALCDAGAWRSNAAPLPASFQLAIAVTLGRLQLPIAQARSLRVGDVLILEQSFSRPKALAMYRLAGSGCMGALTMTQACCV